MQSRENESHWPAVPGENAELVALLARQMPMVLAAGLVVAPVAVYIYRLRLGGEGWLSGWLIAAIGLALARGVFVLAYWRLRSRLPLWGWRAGFMLGSLLSGCLFGGFGWVVAGTGDGPLMVFTIMMLAGLTAGSVASLSADRLVYASFAVSAMGPVVARFGLAPDEPSRWMGALGLVFVLTHLGYSMLQNRTMRMLIRLRNQQQALARDLAEARDRAERSSTEKTRFLLAAGHDLRQPLYAIRLLLDTLDTDDGTRRAERLATIGDSVKAISDLLERMLEAARAGTKGYVPHLAPVSLASIFRQVGVEYAVDAAEKGLDLCFVGSRRFVLTDPALLTQILRNFVGNAVRYTEAGRVLVGVRRRAGQLELQVWDNGPGIADEDISRIFEPFQQLANPGRQSGRGHGLGLTIARGMAEILGSEVIVRSWPGQGSMFALRLPEVAGSADALAEPGPAMAGASMAARPMAAGTILLVEDHAPVRTILAELLSGRGYRVMAFADAEAALAALGQGAQMPDAIVSDLRLPGALDGLAMIRVIRQQAGRHVPAVLVTADPAATSPDEDIPVLLKPVGVAALEEALADMVRFSPGQPAPETP